ncbi:MAG: VOC family protein [Ideonella sp.]|nr:VOC family protein [Ideonella sp.]MCC7458436.1 VOC family protein [Nitrospira sp.]
MKPTPPDWPRLSACVYCRDPHRMIDWLCRAFGFELRLKVEGDGGSVEHSELSFGEAVVMVGGERRGTRWGLDLLGPASVGGANTQGLMLYVDDVDAHCARARAAGAVVVEEPAVHDYGDDYWADRSYGARDPEGHFWWFSQRLRSRSA